MKILQSAAIAKKKCDLWSICLPVLTKYLTASKADSYLRLDAAYTELEKSLVTNPIANRLGYFRTGGLSDLISLIWHFEKELNIGTYSKLRIGLKGLTENSEHRSYYEFCKNHHKKRGLDLLLDQMEKLQSDEYELKRTFEEKQNKALDENFSDTFSITVELPRKIGKSIIQPLQTTLEQIAKAAIQYGQMPGYSIHYNEQKKTPETSYFKKVDNRYHIYLAEVDRLIKPKVSDGLKYIEFLIKNQRVASITELRKITFLPMPKPVKEASLEDPHLEMTSMASSGDIANMAEDDMDVDDGDQSQNSVKYWKFRIKEIEAAIEIYKKKGNQSDELIVAEEELAAAQKKLQEAQSPFTRGAGQKRNKLGKAADTIRKSIEAAKARLKEEDEAIWKHFDLSVKPVYAKTKKSNKTSGWQYAPPKGIPWITE